MISDQLAVNRVGSFWVLSFGIYLPEKDGVWLLNQPRSGDIFVAERLPYPLKPRGGDIL